MITKTSLTKSFRIRNILKEKLSQYEILFRRAPKSWDVNKKPSYRLVGGRSTIEIQQRVMKIEEALRLLNIAINNANMLVAQNILISITSLNKKISLIHDILEQAECIPETRTEQTWVGENSAARRLENVTVQLTPYISEEELEKLRATLKQLEDLLFNTESALAEANGTTIIDPNIVDPLTGQKVDISAPLDEALSF
jgi:hypothetical protein